MEFCHSFGKDSSLVVIETEKENNYLKQWLIKHGIRIFSNIFCISSFGPRWPWYRGVGWGLRQWSSWHLDLVCLWRPHQVVGLGPRATSARYEGLGWNEMLDIKLFRQGPALSLCCWRMAWIPMGWLPLWLSGNWKCLLAFLHSYVTL